MVDSESISRMLNPFVLSLKKMELELNCPLCLKLLSQPVLLPCDHILCSRCSGISTNDKFNCPDCRLPFELKDLRSAKHIERFCTIYQHMSSAISTLLQDFELSFTRTFFPCNKQAEKKHAHITEDESFVDQRQLSPPIDNFKESDSDSWGKEAQFGAKRKFADIFTAAGPNCDTKLAKSHDSNESRKRKFNNAEGQTTDFDGSAIETCVFCHSFRTTEASGDMLHYLNEKPVPGDQVLQPNVIHVHRKCIEWAPQVYYSGETAVNLEAEIMRSSKIKCCSCGLKGAALGCYIKNCRRSFHVPCAYKILECRWDTDNYLVLCPVHASCKLPCDKLKPKKSKNAYNTPIARETSVSSEYDVLPTEKKRRGDWISSVSVCKVWLICGSGLSKEEKVCLDNFAKISGLVVTYQWKHNVTHVIAATDESGACIRTMKYLMAILNGRWVLNMGWIRACLEAKQLVPEEHFEISHDIHGCFDGPKTGRLQAMQKGPKLFDKLAFHFCGFTETSYKSHLESLAAAAGGKLVSEFELHKLKAEKAFIVYCVEPPNDCGSAEFKEVLLERIDAAEVLAAKAGGTAVRHTVFLNAIAAHDLSMLPEKL